MAEDVTNSAEQPASLPDAAAQPGTAEAPPAAEAVVKLDTPEAVEAESRKLFDSIARRHEQIDRAPSDEAPPAESEDAAATEGDGKIEAADESKAKSESAAAEPPEGFDDALAAMVRDGVSEFQIKLLFDSDPKGFVELGLKRAKVQKDVDRAMSTRTRPDTQPAAKAPEAKTGTDAQPAGVAEIAAEALKGMDPYEPVDVQTMGTVLAKVAAQVAQTVKSEMLGEFQKREAERQAQAQYEMVEREIAAAREALSTKHPALKDDATYARVLERYDTIVAGSQGKYQTVGEVFAEAAKWALADENPAVSVDRIKQDLFKRSQQQKRGTPSARSASSAPKKLSTDEIAWQKAQKIFDEADGVLSR